MTSSRGGLLACHRLPGFLDKNMDPLREGLALLSSVPVASLQRADTHLKPLKEAKAHGKQNKAPQSLPDTLNTPSSNAAFSQRKSAAGVALRAQKSACLLACRQPGCAVLCFTAAPRLSWARAGPSADKKKKATVGCTFVKQLKCAVLDEIHGGGIAVTLAALWTMWPHVSLGLAQCAAMPQHIPTWIVVAFVVAFSLCLDVLWDINKLGNKLDKVEEAHSRNIDETTDKLDDKLSTEIANRFKAQQSYDAKGSQTRDAFAVKHFTGDVTYPVDGTLLHDTSLPPPPTRTSTLWTVRYYNVDVAYRAPPAQ